MRLNLGLVRDDAAGAVLASDGPIVAGHDFDRLAKVGVTAVAHTGGPEDKRSVMVGTKEILSIVATNVSHIRY